MYLFRFSEGFASKQCRRQTRDTFRFSAILYNKHAQQDSIAFDLRMTAVGEADARQKAQGWPLSPRPDGTALLIIVPHHGEG